MSEPTETAPTPIPIPPQDAAPSAQSAPAEPTQGETRTGDTAKPQKKKKPSFFQRLRNLRKLRISVRISDEPKAAPPVPAAPPAPSAGDILLGVTETGETPAAPDSPEKKSAKDRGAKKSKPKKAPRKKAKKSAGRKKSKAADHGEKNNRRKVIVGVCIALALVAVGSGTYAALVLSRKVGSAEDMIARAQTLTGQGKYDQAISLYERVIDEGDLVADAYLGMADTLQTADDAEAALPKLEAGYLDTGDDRLLERYEEIAGERPAIAGEDGEAQPVAANQPIRWQDAAFEAMIREALDIPAGQDIYQSDLSAITTLRILGGTHAAAARGDESSGLANRNDVDSYEVDGVVYTGRGDIRSLADVSNFQNLTRLTVAYNRIESIDGVQNLPRLRMLALYANEIEDLSPLEGMDSLRWLYLFNNNISDISPLASLSALEGLSLQHNRVADLSPLARLEALEELYMSNNQVADLSPLGSLVNLRFIYMQNNLVDDLSPLTGLSALTDINFTGNPVTDYAPASHVRNVNRVNTFSN